ncbi:tetratricopeptide repeat protein [Streptomyces sp. NPDC127108]|uniref:tetratricopeptide repeat protein n=1 Tax=Streptomyces sp. NPDC127108 TaxID=3345361 RepID=UPI0036331BF1
MIRERTRARFVGRRAQVSLFTENLTKDPASAEDPADFLFHVRGVGGVGKSTLLRQWQEVARKAGAVTAVVDESDVHGVPQALAELARQLAEQAGPLKEFDKAAEQYRKEQEAAVAESLLPEGADAAGAEASMSSRVVTQAALGAASLIPGVGAATSMASPDAAAQGLDRLRAGIRGQGSRGRRDRGADASGLGRAFVGELDRLCGKHAWVVLFFDTWEQTGRFLDAWLLDLLQDEFGPLSANVIVVLAGRDELAERPWAPLRPHVTDVPLEVFTQTETRTLLAARGVTEPDVVDAVLHLSLGLPLLVELLALAQPESAEEVGAEADVADAAVERFVQWIGDPAERDAVLACALAPRLNEDVFTAAVPEEARGLWGWLCGQPFVSGHGDFKQYHAVVRASMVRQRRAFSPQRWGEAHLQLAEAHGAWRAAIQEDLPVSKRWGDARWLRHRLDEMYHRLCARPSVALTTALAVAVGAADEDMAVLRQWTDAFQQAARDAADPDLLAWAETLRTAVSGQDPAVDFLSAVLSHDALSAKNRSLAHTYRGKHLMFAERNEEALAELDRALAVDPDNLLGRVPRAEAHRRLRHFDEAVADYTAVIDSGSGMPYVLVLRGSVHREAGWYQDAIDDYTAALEFEPTHASALFFRGLAHQRTGRLAEAVQDLTTAFGLKPTAFHFQAQRGDVHRQAGRYDEAISDLTAALSHDSERVWHRAVRGVTYRQAGDFTKAREDLSRVADRRVSDHNFPFELTMLDTVESGLESCRPHWVELLAPDAPQPLEARFRDVFRALILEPSSDLATVTEAFLSGSPNQAAITNLLLYLTELFAVDGALADRARLCHDLLATRSAPVAD